VENELERRIYNTLTSVFIKKDSRTSQVLSQPKKERKINGSEKKFHDLTIVGIGREKGTSHQKKVQKLRQLMGMRLARKKRVEELMAKREGTFLQKNKQAVDSVKG